MDEDCSPHPLNQFAAIVLAAGASVRFGSNKLVHLFKGRPLIEHILDAFEQVDLGRRIVVVGGTHQSELTSLLMRRPAWERCINDRSSGGMGTSIAAGARMLKDSAGVFICPGDMPLISASHIRMTAQLFEDETSICRPLFGGQPGHPVLFGRGHYERLRELDGEQGGAEILQSSLFLRKWNSSSSGVVADVDDPSSLARADIFEGFRDGARGG